MTRQKVTIPDIAREAGVSKSTVSLALQGSTKIKLETRKKVLRVAKRMGYVYNRAAANLRRQSSQVVGMVINDLTNPFFAELAAGLEKSLFDAGYVVMMANTAEDVARQERVVDTLCEHGAAGLLVCPAFATPPSLLARLRDRGMPVVAIMRPLPGQTCDYVAPGNTAGVRAASDHLIAQGLRRLAFIGGLEDTSIYDQRLAGFTEAVAAHGLDADEVGIHPCALTRTAAANTAEALLRADPTVQGIVCYSDVVAFGVMVGLERAGLRPGRDIAVTGFDDVMAARETNPPLTSVRVFTDRLGQVSAQTLMARIEDPERPFATQILEPELVIRDSSCLG